MRGNLDKNNQYFVTFTINVNNIVKIYLRRFVVKLLIVEITEMPIDLSIVIKNLMNVWFVAWDSCENRYFIHTCKLR